MSIEFIQINREKVGTIPKTNLEKFVIPQKTNYLSAFLTAGKKAQGMTSMDIGNALGITDVCAKRKLNQAPDKWKVGELVVWCNLLKLDPSEAFEQAIRK